MHVPRGVRTQDVSVQTTLLSSDLLGPQGLYITEVIIFLFARRSKLIWCNARAPEIKSVGCRIH